MGSVVKKVIHVSDSVRDKIDPLRGGDAILEAQGVKTFTGQGSNNIFDQGATAAAQAAAQQAQATRDAANAQAQATRDAATQQAASIRDQASATVAAQTAAINQSVVAARLAEQQANQQQEQQTPDVQLNGYGDASDPRRRYQGGSVPSIGGTTGTTGGIGIRI
jgi:hypothetical protein